MLKGKTKIELTDINTGEVEVIEKDNLITNALAHQLGVFSSYYDRSDFNDHFCPFAENIMGGIKLFKNTIEEDPNNYYLPNLETNEIIGYASASSTDGTDARRGSRNQLESQEIADGYQFVWDFATTEANGTIQALALTPSEGGEKGWFPHGDETGYLNTVTNAQWLAEVNFDEGYFVVISYNSYVITVNKYNVYFDKLDLTHKVFTNYLVSTDEISIEFPFNTTLYFRDGGDDYWYAIYAQTSTANVPFYVAKLHKKTLEFSYETLTFNNLSLAYYHKDNSTVYDGYLYLPKRPESYKNYVKGFYKINLSNLADITVIDFDEWSSTRYEQTHITPAFNGMMFANGILFSNNAKDVFFPNYGENYAYYYGSVNNSTSFNYYCNYRYFASHGIQIMTRYYDKTYYKVSFGIDRNVLMTINNLPEPIIKTAEKTMKIIYTITYVDENEEVLE